MLDGLRSGEPAPPAGVGLRIGKATKDEPVRQLAKWIVAISLGVIPIGSSDAAVTRYKGVKAAVSGQKSLMGATTNLDDNCRWLGISPASITEPPQRGRLFVMRSIDHPQFTKENERYKCRFKTYPSERLYYQSQPGYIGTDHFQIENITPLGDTNLADFDVVVRSR